MTIPSVLRTIGEKIKYIRENKNISQADLGFAAQVTQESIAAYENGRVKNIPRRKLELIAKELNVPVELFVKSEDITLEFLPEEIRNFICSPENKDKIIAMYHRIKLEELQGD